MVPRHRSPLEPPNLWVKAALMVTEVKEATDGNGNRGSGGGNSDSGRGGGRQQQGQSTINKQATIRSAVDDVGELCGRREEGGGRRIG
jgi:hypothetical protein